MPPVSPEPGNPLAERNARAAEEARTRRAEYASGWLQVQKDTPEITQTEYAKQLGISARTLRRAIAELTPA
ncbi:winged helix-turn-helix domain-containing protein [Streptomyces goshikiensis]|uniref:winged helix-turn-helix domain-containing protein n=1 Tax=Streptomyces goshikiensis TaxID=1942 RepID=UPI00368C97D0